MQLDNVTNSYGWRVGASLQMVFGGMEQEFDMPVSVVILTLGFGVAVLPCICSMPLVAETGLLEHPINTPQIHCGGTKAYKQLCMLEVTTVSLCIVD